MLALVFYADGGAEVLLGVAGADLAASLSHGAASADRDRNAGRRPASAANDTGPSSARRQIR